MNTISTESLIEQLSRTDAYPFPVDQVTVIQTHISVLCFAADWVYKIKKNISFDFLDFSTLALRKHYCEEECRLNSRLSPEMYRGVVPIVRTSDGGLCFEAEGEALEYAVKMKRLPAEFLMDHILETGEIDRSLLNRLVNKIAAFHQSLESVEAVRNYGSVESIGQNVMGNFAILNDYRDGEGGVLSTGQFDFLKAKADLFLKTHRVLFEKRVSDGKIKEGHGDLHAGNICMTPDDIMIYDCVEFSQAFRCSDVIGDLAFFVMDLDKRGFRNFSRDFVAQYISQMAENEQEFSTLLGFYKTYRALVRAKVEAVQSSSPDQSIAVRKRHLSEARKYVRLALTYQIPECLVILCGLPGSGKSWVSRRIAQPFDAVVLRTDLIRKELTGREIQHQPGSAFGAGIYSDAMTDNTYRKAADLASGFLVEGKTVVVDAGFALQKYRDIFRSVALKLKVSFIVLQLNCSEKLIEEHMNARKTDRDEVSDADLSVHKKMAAVFERPDEFADWQRLIWDSGGDPDLLLLQFFDKLIENLAQAAAGQ